MLQRVQAILVLAGVDDLAVELRRRIQVVVVVVQAGLLERGGLLAAEHAQGGAGFQAQALHRAHDLGDLHHVTVLGAAPRGAHAEAAGAGALGGLRAGHHGLHAH